MPIINFLIATALAQARLADRSYEGDRFVSDDTDNNRGERKVYAFKLHLEPNDPDFVTLTMRCSNGKPALFVEWEDLAFPDEAVLTFGPVATADSEPAEEKYIFQNLRTRSIAACALRPKPLPISFARRDPRNT